MSERFRDEGLRYRFHLWILNVLLFLTLFGLSLWGLIAYGREIEENLANLNRDDRFLVVRTSIDYLMKVGIFAFLAIEIWLSLRYFVARLKKRTPKRVIYELFMVVLASLLIPLVSSYSGSLFLGLAVLFDLRLLQFLFWLNKQPPIPI